MVDQPGVLLDLPRKIGALLQGKRLLVMRCGGPSEALPGTLLKRFRKEWLHSRLYHACVKAASQPLGGVQQAAV
jgi:hypothetical protein